jgi:hypothetical protein
MRKLLTYLWQHSCIAALLVALAVTPVTLITTGCNSAAVVTDIQKFAPVVVNVLELACTFTPGAPLCATGAAMLNSSITAVTNAITGYQAKVKAGTATASDWNYINALFGTFEDQSASIFNLLHVSSGGTQAEALAIEASAKVLLSAIEALFPAPPAIVAVASRPSARFVASMPSPAVAFDSNWFKAWEKDYNRKVDAAKKANPKASLSHVHSALVTRLTLGKVK